MLQAEEGAVYTMTAEVCKVSGILKLNRKLDAMMSDCSV